MLIHILEASLCPYSQGGGGGGGGTLIFLYIRRLVSIFRVQFFLILIFLGFSRKMNILGV